MRPISRGGRLRRWWPVCAALLLSAGAATAEAPRLLTDKSLAKSHFLPDFSYAGYRHGQPIPRAVAGKVIQVTDYGAVADDDIDDSKAVLKALAAAHEVDGPVVVQFPPGRLILSDILYIERSNIVLRGAGSGPRGTVLYFPRPLRYLEDPEDLAELREYLVSLNKFQREANKNINHLFSQYSWSGGFIWTRVPGERVKYYLPEYDTPAEVLARVRSGKRGDLQVTVDNAAQLKVGDVVQLNWYNKQGENSSLLRELYAGADIFVGSHHWTAPEQPLISQQLRIQAIRGQRVTLSAPLLHDIRAEWHNDMTRWRHLSEVGFEHLRIEFPDIPAINHHLEEGFNALYLTRLYDSWVHDVHVVAADSGVFVEDAANLTILDVETSGAKTAHYSVAMGGAHNVLVKGLRVRTPVVHHLSFNTRTSRSVYTDAEVLDSAVLDQHAGANHQNLFDNIRLHASLARSGPGRGPHYPLFRAGGARYWKPSHGVFNTLWNIKIVFDDGFEQAGPVRLHGVNDGPEARLIGIHGNREVALDYGPNAYEEGTNTRFDAVPSLYDYQLRQRLGRP